MAQGKAEGPGVMGTLITLCIRIPQTLRGRSLVLVYESVPHSPLQDSHIPQIIHTSSNI